MGRRSSRGAAVGDLDGSHEIAAATFGYALLKFGLDWRFHLNCVRATAVVTEVLQTYHAPQAPAADLAAIGALGLGFAQAIARKYQQPFAGTAIPVMTLVCPPSFVGVLLYSAVKAQLWHVPANDIDTAICGVSDVKKEDCIKESENSDVDDGLFSDEGDNASDSSEQDDAQLALELSAEEVPRELRVDSPGKNAIAPIVAEQRLRSRKPVLYVS